MMNLYLDDNISNALLIRLLRRDGHDVVSSNDFGMSGASDVAQFEKKRSLLGGSS
jgi:hypothetical protein